MGAEQAGDTAAAQRIHDHHLRRGRMFLGDRHWNAARVMIDFRQGVGQRAGCVAASAETQLPTTLHPSLPYYRTRHSRDQAEGRRTAKGWFCEAKFGAAEQSGNPGFQGDFPVITPKLL
jgi:hypothetical protein